MTFQLEVAVKSKLLVAEHALLRLVITVDRQMTFRGFAFSEMLFGECALACHHCGLAYDLSVESKRLVAERTLVRLVTRVG